MGMPVSLIGHMHVCPMVDPGPVPHVGGPVVQVQQSFVLVEGRLMATVGDKTLCTPVGKLDAIVSGSSIVRIDGKPVARLSDSCSHGGRLVKGEPWILMD